MAESVFFRPPDQELVKELNKRYLGETNLRASSLFVDEDLFSANPSIPESLEDERIYSWAAIYNEDEELVLARGDQALIDQTKQFNLNDEPYPAYGFTGLEVELGGKFGSLRNCALTCQIIAPKPERGSDEYNEIFSFIEQSFYVGKRILVQYGYFDPFKDDQVIGYNEKFHRTPVGSEYNLPGKTNLSGYVFTVTDPSYTILSDGTVRFNIKGIGPGGEALERSLLPNANKSFVDIFLNGDNRNSTTGFRYKSIVEQDSQMPYFITDYDLDDDEGRYLQVQNIVDWIDFDVQSRLRHFSGDDVDDDFETLNGRGLINPRYNPSNPNGGNHWKNPPVDPRGDYSNVGFVCLQFLEEGYYDNTFAINTNTNDDYAYYVTLQYLTWLINWTAQSELIPVEADNLIRQQVQRTGEIAPGVPPSQKINQGLPSDDVYRYIIKCDSETTRGRLRRTTKNKKGEEEKFFLPSADPCSVLFTYGNSIEDPLATANYGIGHNKYNWLYAVAGGAVIVAGTAVGLGALSAPAVILGGAIAAGGFFEEVEPIILFSDEDFDVLQAAPIDGGSHRAFQSRLSLQGDSRNNIADLSKILINRDCLASILDELGGLKRASVESKEENLAKIGDIQPATNTDVTKISFETFFNKLFSVIKQASGGAVDLFLLPDPDETDVFTSRLLIKNRKEPTAEEKIKIPMFNRNDGNSLDINLSSKIPKAMQVAAAVGDNLIKPDDTKEEDEAEQDQVIVPPGPIMYIDIYNGKDALTKSKFSADSVQALSQILTKINSKQSKKDKIKFGTELFPLEMALRIQGIEGFKFGDVIQTKMLPSRYLNKDGGNRIIFSVLSVKHLHSNAGWETELKTIMRFAPKEMLTLEQIDSDFLSEYD